MGRRRTLGRSKPSGTPLYSKQDIREQYCITERQLHGLEHASTGLFGCLSSYHESSCSSRSPSLLTVCMKGRAPSDENLAELCRRPARDYAPLPRAAWPPPPYPVHFHHPHRPLYPDPYAWLPEDEEPCRMERPRPLRGFEYEMYPRRYLSYSTEYLHGRHEPCPAHPHLPPPPPPPTIPSVPHRQKHVSFARSHTMQSFDDAVSFGSGSCVTTCSQERLIDGKKSTEPAKVIVMEKAKRAPMKTQATQTEVCLGRKPLPPNYLSLSPRSVHKVRMVSQGAQTNGEKNNGRRLMKSYSEVGGKFGNAVGGSTPVVAVASVHEPLQRTQSEEPPRSPFTPTSPKEILIDFEPLEKRGRKRILAKTLSDGEILEGARGERDEGGTQSDGELTTQRSASAVPPIDDEPLEKRSITDMESPAVHVKQLSTQISADSQEEEFHENIIYGELYRKRSVSAESSNGGGEERKSGPLVPNTPSPFASCDSLNTVTRDHSDGIWNESQATVLHADSDNNGGGTGVSCSDLSTCLTPGAAVNSMTPTSRRKHLLMMQHQQRSSMDTEVFDIEEPEMEVPLSPRVKADSSPPGPTVSVTIPVQDSKKIVANHIDRKTERALSPTVKGKKRSGGTRTPESEPHHSSSATLSSVENFARSDSGRTNTDMSETSTTDDYATATENNSDASSRPPGGESLSQTAQGGGSFESGSSLYSLTRADATEEQQVPCSPQPIEEEELDRVSECADDRRSRDGESSCAESSSSGSYSVDGSSDKLVQSDRSGQCSSPGDYDSPPDDHPKNSVWTEEEKSKVKKGFKLELSTKEEAPENSIGVSSWQGKSQGMNGTAQDKAKSRSPVQASNKRTPNQANKDATTPSMVRSPAMHEGFRAEDWVTPQRLTPEEKRNFQKSKVSNGLRGQDTSEESSDECACGKSKRTRESPRRKMSGAKSPTALARDRRRSVSEEAAKRRCSIITKSPSPVAPGGADDSAGNSGGPSARLSPHAATHQSPPTSPNNRKHKNKVNLSPLPTLRVIQWSPWIQF